MVEGCLDDQDAERSGGLLDDMDEALTSEGGLLLESGPPDLCDPHDPDLDDSNRAIRYTVLTSALGRLARTNDDDLCFFFSARPPVTTSR